MKEDRKVRRQIAWRETEVGVVKRVATVCLVPPRVRALGHDEKAGAVFAGLVWPPIPHRSAEKTHYEYY